jgi:phosphate acyltransferase
MAMTALTIALDAMGGDFGISIILPAAELALKQHPQLHFILVGDEPAMREQLLSLPLLSKKSALIHTDIAIKMDDKPSKALRYGRKVSSMWRAIDMVKEGRAQAAVSAGNTGALMAMAAFNLKMREGIERPAIAGTWPTLDGECIVLDLGASIGATSHDLVKMALMGAAMARVLFNKEKPSIGLLNIGSEEAKGLEFIREASELLKISPLNYKGFVEGSDIGKGLVDVVVTEGFTGNIALKAAEGTAKQFGAMLKAGFSSSLRAKLGYLLARPALNAMREKMDPNKSNGGIFLGLNGLVIKSHGGADVAGFASAINVAMNMVQQDLDAKITTLLNEMSAKEEETHA